LGILQSELTLQICKTPQYVGLERGGSAVDVQVRGILSIRPQAVAYTNVGLLGVEDSVEGGVGGTAEVAFGSGIEVVEMLGLSWLQNLAPSSQTYTPV
jgi:hypothetical protein